MTDLHDMIVPVWKKQNLTIEEAAAYSNIGQNKLRQLSDDDGCPFVLHNKRLIKRKQFDRHIDSCYSI